MPKENGKLELSDACKQQLEEVQQQVEYMEATFEGDYNLKYSEYSHSDLYQGALEKRDAINQGFCPTDREAKKGR